MNGDHGLLTAWVDGAAEPVHFGEPGQPLFGVWHSARTAGPGGVGVVLCSAWGREEVCSHATLRHLAARLAEAGLPTLRFDYPGCGDSAGDGESGDQFAQWLRGIHAAIDEMRRRATGVRRVVLVGLRLGAALALLAAAARDDVIACAALMPVVSGRRYLRELQVLQGDPVGEAEPAEFESGGFCMNALTRAAVGRLDLKALALGTSLPAPNLLVIDRADLPAGPSAWSDALRERGAEVRHLALDGYAEMMLDPHLGQVARPVCDGVLDWLRGLWPVAFLGGRRPMLRLVGGGSGGGGAPLAPVSRQVDAHVAERPVLIGSGPGGIGVPMWGVLSEPARVPASGRAVLILNAGATRRIGPGRLWVSVARRLAALGQTVLRLDLSGLGDSPAQPGCSEGVVYAEGAVDEAMAAMNFLREHTGGAECHVLGLCAGAHHAVHAALKACDAGSPFDGIVAVNPLTFYWHAGMSLETPLPAHQVTSEMARYRGRLLSADFWRKLLGGGIDPRVPLRVVSRRLAQRGGLLARAAGRRLGRRVADDLGADLTRLARAGVQLEFVFAEGEPGLALLAEQGGAPVSRLRRAGLLHITRCPGADHTFTRHVAREHLLRVLVALLAGGAVPVHRDNGRREHA